MGPRSFDHGNFVIFCPVLIPFRKLQWGHGLSTMETLRERANLIRHSSASMGPRSFDHGNLLLLGMGGYILYKASMGPRSFDHGNSLIYLFDGGFRALGTLSKCFATENNKFCFPVRVLRGKLPSCERS